MKKAYPHSAGMPFFLHFAPFFEGEPVIEAELAAKLRQKGTKLSLQGCIALIALGSFDSLVACHFLVCLTQIFPMKNRLPVRMLSAVC